jgi:hypothetical protein
MAVTLRVVKNPPNESVIGALLYLLQEAKAGRISGLAYVTAIAGQHLSADLVGTARSSPVVALASAKAIEVAVSKLVE